MWSKRLPHAIINDTLVSVGDTVMERRVVTIGQDEVVLEVDAKKEILKMDTAVPFEIVQGASARGKRNGARKRQ